MMKIPAFKHGPYLLQGTGVIAAIMAADQLTKWLVMEKLLHVAGAEGQQVVPLLPGLNFVMVWNRGVSFGLFDSNDPVAPFILCAVSLMICVPLLIWLAATQKKLAALALSMVTGGALGNIIDRLRFGAVADFIDVYVKDWHWPAFNLADSAIVIGAGLLMLDALRDQKE